MLISMVVKLRKRCCRLKVRMEVSCADLARLTQETSHSLSGDRFDCVGSWIPIEQGAT